MEYQYIHVDVCVVTWSFVLLPIFHCDSLRTVLNAEKMKGRPDVSVAGLIFGSLGNFLLMFLGSALIGILFALVTALVSIPDRGFVLNWNIHTCTCAQHAHAHTHTHTNNIPSTEQCMIFLILRSC